MKFTDFLKQKLYEYRQKEGIKDYYFLPINIEKTANNPQKKAYLIADLLKCVKYIIEEYQNLRLSDRVKNVDFIERSGLHTTHFSLRYNIGKILYTLEPKDFLGEWVETNSTAYEFLVKISDIEKRINVKFKDKSLTYEKLYIKFDIVHDVVTDNKNRTRGIMKPIRSRKNYILIDLADSMVDLISLHVST